MGPRARASAVVVGVTIVVAAFLAMREDRSTPPGPSTQTPQPSTTSALVAAPPPEPLPPPLDTTIAPTPSVVAMVASAKRDPRCAAGVWVDDDLAHSNGGQGCVVAGDAGLVREGFWIVKDVDGNTKSGTFENGRFDGKWVSRWPNGQEAWEMSYSHGIPNGWRYDWNADGFKTSERYFLDGSLDGTVTLTYPDGRIVHEEWRKGIRIDIPDGAVPP
jgi:hypothetical protein